MAKFQDGEFYPASIIQYKKKDGKYKIEWEDGDLNDVWKSKSEMKFLAVRNKQFMKQSKYFKLNSPQPSCKNVKKKDEKINLIVKKYIRKSTPIDTKRLQKKSQYFQTTLKCRTIKEEQLLPSINHNREKSKYFQTTLNTQGKTLKSSKYFVQSEVSTLRLRFFPCNCNVFLKRFNLIVTKL